MKRKTHKGFYERYFEDYREEEVPNANGKGTHIQRAYIGFYYRAKLSRQRRVLVRVLYVLLFIVATALFLHAATRSVPCNVTWYCALPSGVVLFCLLWMLIPLGSYIIAKEKMTVSEYKSTAVRVQKWSRLTAIALGVTAVLALLATLANHDTELVAGLFCGGEYTLAALSMAAMWYTEHCVVYEQMKNANGRIITDAEDEEVGM